MVYVYNGVKCVDLCYVKRVRDPRGTIDIVRMLVRGDWE
jgi:hypothetical protein